MNRPERGAAPWSGRDLVPLVAIVAVGAVVCGLAWNGVSTRSQLEDQKGWIAVGVAGFLGAAAAQTVWARRVRRVVAGQAARIRADLAALVTPDPALTPTAGRSEGLVAIEGMHHFHRPECPIARGREWAAAPRRAHEAAGRTPCGICFRGTPPDPRGRP